MSYILDALKKSEKERQHGSVPNLLTVQDTVIQEPKKKRLLLPYLLIVALLLNAGVLVWWLSTSETKKTKVVNTIPAGVFKAEKDFAPKSETRVAEPAEKPVDVVHQVPIQSKVQSNQTPTFDTRRTPEISPDLPQQTPDEPLRSTDTASIPKQVFNLRDLPLHIRQSLPAFSISVAVYSDVPANRMIKINGQMLQEGQYLTAGLKLEEIKQEGIIFSYQNYHFRVGMNE